MGRFIRKVVRRVEKIVAWIVAIWVVVTMAAGVLWLVTLL